MGSYLMNSLCCQVVEKGESEVLKAVSVCMVKVEVCRGNVPAVRCLFSGITYTCTHHDRR